MATRIPLPGNGAEYLQKGVESGTNLWQQLLGKGIQQAQMQQQWQQHLRNAAIREQQEERLRALQPWQMEALRLKVENLKNQASLSPEQKRAQRMEEFREKEDYKARRKAISQEEIRENKLNEFRDKEKIKQEMKGEENLSKPTKAVITTNQNIVNAVNNVVPQLKALKNIKTPNLATGKITDPDTYALYESSTDATADSLMAAFKWLGIQASLDMAKNMTKRKPLESDSAYHHRIDELVKELEMRGRNAEKVFSGSKVELNQKKRKRYNLKTGQFETGNE